MRAVSGSQPSWVQHCVRACAPRPSLLRAPCIVRIIPPVGVSWIVACSTIAESDLNPLAASVYVCVCMCNVCNTFRVTIFVRSLMDAARKSSRDIMRIDGKSSSITAQEVTVESPSVRYKRLFLERDYASRLISNHYIWH